MSELLSLGQTPEEWSKHLAGHGVHVSPRLIRSKARATGNYRQLGHLMLLLPSHIEALTEPGTPETDQKEGPAVQTKIIGEEG
ncbi:MAG: hypothetical protein ABJH45_07065 [Paracoccaceae bacterium]